jgi:predicted SnoaL-like aldol condensation-catalyzing enzyme
MVAVNGSDLPDRLSANKDLVRRFCEAFYNRKEFDRAAEFLSERFINHHPGAGVGRLRTIASFREQVADRFPDFSIQVKATVAEFDFVWTYSVIHLGGDEPEAVSVDIWRLEAGLLVEKWDVGQRIDSGISRADLL